MSGSRKIICPQCGNTVRIPWFWVFGIEGIFRCRGCKILFKTGYKMGAVLAALGLSLSVVTVQMLVYVFSIYFMPLFVLALIPIWIFYAYWLRRWYMTRKIKRKVRKQNNAEIT